MKKRFGAKLMAYMEGLIDRLERSNRKTISIVVDENCLVVVKAPHNVSDKYLREMIANSKDWIDKKKHQIGEKKSKEVVYQDGTLLKVFNQEYTIKAVADFKYAMQLKGTTIYISEELIPEARNLLPNVVKILCKRTFPEIVSYWSKIMGLSYKEVKISSAKGSWGSCSNQKNINLNWRLAFAEKNILDYIVIHELAHIVEMNHSPKFWKIVEKFCPDYKNIKHNLKENGRLIDL